MAEIVFNNPVFLWYLISVPLLIVTHFFLLRHIQRKGMKFANFETLKRVAGEKLLTKNLTVLIIRCFILICLILSVAETVFWYRGMSNNNDFVIAIDSSASMSAEDLTPSRLEAAKEYAMNFVDSVDSRASFSVISFSGATFIEQTPTQDKGKVKEVIRNIVIESASGTDIAVAMITGSNLMLNSENGKTIILITDGSNTAGIFTSDSVGKGIKYAQENHVIVDTLGIGSLTGPIGYLPEYYNISTAYDAATLMRISNETQGHYFNAKTKDELKQAYDAIAGVSHESLLDINLSYALLIIALILVFVEWGLINTRYRAVP